MTVYRDAGKSLAWPGKKQATATEDFEFHIYPIYNHNWRNISTIYIYNKTSIKRNILTIKQEVCQAKDLSAPLYVYGTESCKQNQWTFSDTSNCLINATEEMVWDSILF